MIHFLHFGQKFIVVGMSMLHEHRSFVKMVPPKASDGAGQAVKGVFRWPGDDEYATGSHTFGQVLDDAADILVMLKGIECENTGKGALGKTVEAFTPSLGNERPERVTERIGRLDEMIGIV